MRGWLGYGCRGGLLVLGGGVRRTSNASAIASRCSWIRAVSATSYFGAVDSSAFAGIATVPPFWTSVVSATMSRPCTKATAADADAGSGIPDAAAGTGATGLGGGVDIGVPDAGAVSIAVFPTGDAGDGCGRDASGTAGEDGCGTGAVLVTGVVGVGGASGGTGGSGATVVVTPPRFATSDCTTGFAMADTSVALYFFLKCRLTGAYLTPRSKSSPDG